MGDAGLGADRQPDSAELQRSAGRARGAVSTSGCWRPYCAAVGRSGGGELCGRHQPWAAGGGATELVPAGEPGRVVVQRGLRGGGGHWRANAGLRDVLAGGPVVCHPRAIGESILAWYGGLLAGVAAGATLVRTFIGPVYRGGGYGDRGHGRVFVGVERFFKPGSNCRWRGSDGLDSTC